MQDYKFVKKKNKEHWWQSHSEGKKPFTSILFVPPTPRGELAKMLKKREVELNKNSDMNIRIVERGGPKMKHILVKKNPFPPKKCDINFCPFCNEDKNIEICSKTGFNVQVLVWVTVLSVKAVIQFTMEKQVEEQLSELLNIARISGKKKKKVH